MALVKAALPPSLHQPFHLHRNAPHPRDCVQLQESNHIYFNLKDHAKRYTSVTTFIGGFFHEFEGNAVIQKYYEEWQITIHKCVDGKMVHRNSAHYSMSDDEFLRTVEGASLVERKHKYYGMTPGEILFKWNEGGLEASEKGTAHHANIENFYNETGTHDPTTPEFQLFLEAMSTHSLLRPLVPYRMEWVIYSERLQLAGSMDGLFRLPAGHPDGLPNRDSYVILDWKFIKKYDGPLAHKAPPEWARFGKSPATCDLLECHYHKYRIQLLIYAYILETEYDMPVSGMANLAFNVAGVELAGVSWGANMNQWEYLPYQRDDDLVAALVSDRLAQIGGRDESDPQYMYAHLRPTCASLREWGLEEWDGVSLRELERLETADDDTLKRARPEDDPSENPEDGPVKKRRIAVAAGASSQ